MGYIKNLLAQISGLVMLIVLSEMLLPKGTFKQGARFLLGLLMLAQLLAPLYLIMR